MPKKLNLESEYKKELRRVKRLIKGIQKRGFLVNYAIPKQPKTITRGSISRLQRITPDKVYDKSIYRDPKTGDILSGQPARKLAKRRASEATKAKKGSARAANSLPRMSDIVLQNVESMISGWQPMPWWSASYARLKEKDKNIVQRSLQGAINSLGRDAVAANLEAHATEINDLMFHVLYGASDFKWEDVQADIAALVAIFWNRHLSIYEAKHLQDYIDLTSGAD